ncbi:MAG: [FeFe] hydrogenase, group A [Christensenella sp.]|nr:[FeFe] hydrogenase, group A [Christensenella sp.]
MADKKMMIVDGISVEIENERNLLEVIRKIGIELPTFCYSSELSIYGACRMCMVENEKGGLEAACSTIPRAGMNIKTNTVRLQKYRKNILELLLANHCSDCTTCDKSTKCRLQELAKRFQIHNVRFPNTAKHQIDDSSACITRDAGKCILCGDCVRMCNETQNVGAIDFTYRSSKVAVNTAFGKPIGETNCVGCGQCAAVCPTGAIVVKNETEKLWKAIENPNVKVVVQIAPAVRVAIGKDLFMKDGEDVMGKIVAALRRMGVDEVYDTAFSADLTVIEESNEFIERLQNGGKLPLITSCCPGWIQYAENTHPELMENISSCKSPMQMFSAIIKDQARQKKENIFHVAIMPCSAKKFEAQREEFKHDDIPDVDLVITTKELIKMIRKSGIIFDELEPEAIDMPFGTISGAGVIFGVTGGVTEAVLRRVADTNSRADYFAIEKMGQRGMVGIKEFDLPYGDSSLHIGVVSGLKNAETIIQRVKNGEKFDFIEIMACPNGCINGGGQPRSHRPQREARTAGIYKSDKLLSIRRAQANPIVDKVYKEIIQDRNHELLHVHYTRVKH